MTTEELMAAALRTVQQMSLEAKAELRRTLDLEAAWAACPERRLVN